MADYSRRVPFPEWAPACGSGTMEPVSPNPEATWFYAVAILAVGAAAGVAAWLCRGALRHREQALEQLVEQRTAELAKLGELTRTLNDAILPEDVLNHVYSSFRSTIPYERIGFALYEEEHGVVCAAWARSENPSPGLPVGYRTAIDKTSLRAVMEGGEPRVIDDLERYLAEHPDSDSTERIVREGMRSSLTCPLTAMGRTVGFLFFSSATPGVYNQGHVDFMRQIAGQLSMIISKSTLYKDLLATKERLEAANRELESLASADGLTGVANRRAFDRGLEREWRRAVRAQAPLSLLLIDVDFFKAYNDRYGHAAGDDCLRGIASTLAVGARRAGDLVARYGGEEFGVVLPDCSDESARQLAERLRERIAGLALPHDASDVAPHVTISVGGATSMPKSGVTAGDLIRSADEALYEAKRGGRDRVNHRRLDAVP
jgi:diguanylate cyclase (GGDEF)-like protein